MPGEPPYQYSKPLPRHIAIIMDGNGRWAKNQKKPRFFGHKAGVETVRTVVKACAKLNIEVLTLFAFSSENWRRPEQEVSLLMELLYTALQREVSKLHENNVRLRIVGERRAFSDKLQERLAESERLTANNSGLTLVVAVNYGGRWDMAQSARKVARLLADGKIHEEDIDQDLIHEHMSLAGLPDPDLFIRTGGEKRISNFLLWQLAYAELFFTDILWPDFTEQTLNEAIESFSARQRRFGRTSEQVETTPSA
ncbi:MAG: isoprenyl transferase [Gammaproteobacteria bacterium]|nr:isoprenyl transferase [Gammaproteobacteria bacterium]MDH5802794.1 isoprenyl transferase [Gammaproteobacteria bacterium]